MTEDETGLNTNKRKKKIIYRKRARKFAQKYRVYLII